MQAIITGADGRIGRMLHAVWAAGPPPQFQPIWASRRANPALDVTWDIETGPAPPITKGSVILHLAGVVRGDATALRANSAMALKVCIAAKEAGAKHVFLASSAAVYGGSPNDLREVHAPAPRSDYGRAKRDMERAALSWARDAGPDTPGVTCLRIGNVLGADALFGHATPARDIVLDPAPGNGGGPQRSYIGPQLLARVIAALLEGVARGGALPPILNVAAREPVFMADLLTAAQLPYRFGPVNPDLISKVCLSTKRLSELVHLPPMTAGALVDDWRAVTGCFA